MSHSIFLPDELHLVDRGDGSGRMLIGMLEGDASIDIGDLPERFNLPRGSVCVLQPKVVRQLRNDGDADVLFFIVGAPPEEGGADYFPDVD